MPHAFIMDFAGGSMADYDAVVEKMGLAGRLPAGALAHVAAPSDGGLRVMDVWEAPETFERFAGEQIGPLSGEQGMAPPEIRSFACHRFHRASDERPAFAQMVVMPGVDLPTFDRLDEQIRTSADAWPEGIVWHAVGLLGDSACVIDTWRDKALRDRFMETQVAPVMQSAPLTGAPGIEEYAVHGSLDPAGAGAAA